MIRWEIETPKRRETIRRGFVNDELRFIIKADKVGGPWIVHIIDPYKVSVYYPKTFINVFYAKEECEAILVEMESGRFYV